MVEGPKLIALPDISFCGLVVRSVFKPAKFKIK